MSPETRTCPSCGAEWMKALKVDTCPGCGVALAPVARRQMGQPDATAICKTCDRPIVRQWWGNGGWLWVHRETQRDNCYPVSHAEPDEATLTEMFPDG